MMFQMYDEDGFDEWGVGMDMYVCAMSDDQEKQERTNKTM